MKTRIHLVIAAGAALLIASQALAVPITIVDNLPGTFIDIAQTGTRLNIPSDGSAVTVMPIGNFVLPAGNIVVGENGGIGFRNPPSNVLTAINSPISSNDAFGCGEALLPAWDDTDGAPGAGKQGGVMTLLASSDRYVVQYNQVAHGTSFLGAPPTATFQVQIFSDPIGPQGIIAQFIYSDILQPSFNGGASATIGFQDCGGDGFNDVQWSFNQPGAVTNGTVLSLIVPEPATMSLLALAGALLARRRIDRR